MKLKMRTIILTVISGLLFLSICSAQEIQTDKSGRSLVSLQSDETDGCQDGSCNLSEHNGQNSGG